MALSSNSLRHALDGGLPSCGDAMELGKAVAARVCGWLQASRAESEMKEVYHWASNVEFVLRNGDYWAIECLSPTDFRMYPGLVRGETVTWANIWVRDTDMSLDELVADINHVAFRAGKEEMNA